jgi:hypothetical protein
MLLGTLVKKERELKNIRPPLTSPYVGHSVTGVIDIISEIREPKWIPSANKHSKKSAGIHPCTITEKMEELLDEIRREIRGLELGRAVTVEPIIHSD